LEKEEEEDEEEEEKNKTKKKKNARLWICHEKFKVTDPVKTGPPFIDPKFDYSVTIQYTPSYR
jgi:hypothetical protein